MSPPKLIRIEDYKMSWSKDLQKSYAHIQAIRTYLIDCVECQSPITPEERDENNGMCKHCYEEKVKKRG